MSRRMVDVDGHSPDSVLIAAATQDAYGDDPWERMVLISGWVCRGECTRAEVQSALEAAQVQMVDDPDDNEMAQAVVVLSRVVRALYRD